MEITMDESFVQGVVGGVLNRHKDRTLDKKRISTLAVEIAANLDKASLYVDVRKNPLNKEMWTSWKPTNETDEQAYLEYWTCDICNEHTHEVDYDYLGSGTNHLGCELKVEMLQKKSDKIMSEMDIDVSESDKEGNQSSGKRYNVLEYKQGGTIFESPDNGKTVYERKVGNPKRKLVKNYKGNK